MRFIPEPSMRFIPLTYIIIRRIAFGAARNASRGRLCAA